VTEGVTRAVVTENGESPYAVTIKVSGHTIYGDEPASFGGNNTGPAPYDLLAASLAECTAITVRWYAEKQNWPLEEVEVSVEFYKQEVEGRSHPVDVFEKHVTIRGPDLTQEQRLKLMEVSAKSPVHRSLENTPIIKTI
jgi:putative redox protein